MAQSKIEAIKPTASHTVISSFYLALMAGNVPILYSNNALTTILFRTKTVLDFRSMSSIYHLAPSGALLCATTDPAGKTHSLRFHSFKWGSGQVRSTHIIHTQVLNAFKVLRKAGF